MGAGRPARGAVRLLRARPAGLPHLPGEAADTPSVSSTRGVSFSTRHPTFARASRAPPQRADGVRLGLRAAAYLGLTTPRTTCAAHRTSCGAPTAAAGSDAAGRRTIPGLPARIVTTKRAGRSHCPHHEERGAPAGSLPTTRASSRSRRPSTGCGPTRSRIAPTAPARRLLRMDRVGRLDQPPGSQLLLHQQLAGRATGRQPANRQRDRLKSSILVIALLGGIGILFGVFGRWRSWAWHGREQASLSFRAPRGRGADACAAGMCVVLLGRSPRCS